MAPFAVDLYLPTFPQMSEELASSASGVQLTLTAFLVGIAAGQLVFGVLSDRFGRRGPLLIGMIVCVAAGVVAAGAPTIEVLIAARALQGFSGASGVVISRAIVVDLVHGNETARSLSLMAALGGIAPVAAPMVGGLLSPVMGWRGMMVILAVIAVLMLFAVIFFVPETYPREKREHAPHESRGNLRALIKPRFIAYTAVLLLAFGSLMAYISASPFVFQVMMGLSPLAFGIIFGVNALVSILASVVSSRTVNRFGARRILGVGVSILVVSNLSVFVLALFPDQIVWTIASFAAMSFGMGLTLGNSTALALNEVRNVAGSGSAILGALQFTAGAALSPLVGLAGSSSALPLGIVMTVTGIGAVVAYLSVRDRTPGRQR